MHYTRQRRGQDLTTSFRQRVTDLPIDEVVRLYIDEQWSTIKIGRYFGIADVTVSKILKENNISIRGIRYPRLFARKARGKLNEMLIVSTYRAINDIGVYELARLHNANATTIKTILRDHGLSIRSIKQVRHAGKWKAGSEHRFWNPNRTEDERKKTRRTIDVSNWRVVVFKRDNFECQSCRVTGKRLEAHHIESWSTCPEKRFDIANGITFCRDCHVSFHWQFGKRNNNHEQLARFLTSNMKAAA